MNPLLAVGSMIVICLSLASCGTQPATTSLDPANPDVVPSAQATVHALAAARPSGDIPAHFTTDIPADVVRNADDFDVNDYFKVLTHLTVEPAWAIDYLYEMDGMGGGPFIYARPADQAPYASSEAYVAATAEAAGDTGADRDASREYLSHIRVDGTREGYFQLVALMTMADQFFLYWHANYNDNVIVADQEALEALLKETGSAFESDELPSDVRNRARKIDLTPTVAFPDDSTAVVRVVTFSKWGGFIESTYSLSRTFPHTVLDETHTTLVEYDCGVQF